MSGGRPVSVCSLRAEADRKRAVLRAFVAEMHRKRADDLVALEADPAALRSIKAIGGTPVDQGDRRHSGRSRRSAAGG